MTATAEKLEQLLVETKKVIVGQEHMLERLMVALLAQGHVLLEGLPGVAKTLTISTLAKAVGADFARIQFTPDLLPSDIVGTRIWKPSSESFDLEWGPVFTNFILADEINRAPAKVQSAMLEVMAERQVSIAGQTKAVPKPFLVMATQNPIESEGVYPLPEAQRDRFMMKVMIDYPTAAQEAEIVQRMATGAPEPETVMSLADLEDAYRMVHEVYVDSSVSKYAVDLVMSTRNPSEYGLDAIKPFIEWGVSPRATLSLLSGARAIAVLRGRNYATAQDVFDIARDVLRHRLILSYEALAAGTKADDVINQILTKVPALELPPMQSELSVSP